MCIGPSMLRIAYGAYDRKSKALREVQHRVRRRGVLPHACVLSGNAVQSSSFSLPALRRLATCMEQS